MDPWPILILSPLLSLFPSLGAVMARAAQPAGVNLPANLGAWTRSGEVREILPGKIFDYMDGAGELYLGYRFKHLDVAEYSSPGEDRILVELYWMESADDAFGLLSGDWGGEPVDLEKVRTSSGGPSRWPGYRALYGAGLLRIWSDSLYARVMAYRESAQSRDSVLRLGRLITSGREVPPAPALLDSLPQKVSDGFALRADRLCYFRSHLVLNSVYFLSTKNILDLDRSAEAVTVSYAPSAGRVKGRYVQLIVIRYAAEETAKKAVTHFEQAYLPEKSRTGPPGGSRFHKVEDGWMGYASRSRFVVLVFECPTRDSAVQFIDDSIGRLENLEDRHE